MENDALIKKLTELSAEKMNLEVKVKLLEKVISDLQEANKQLLSK